MPEDELASLLASFRADVRILVLDDSSSSGTVRRSAVSFLDELPGERGPLTREIPPDVAQRTYRTNQQLYDDIQHSLPSRDSAVLSAAVLTIAGFREDQLAGEGPRNGLFTETTLRVWDGGRFEGDYARFVKEIAALMPPIQVPRLSEGGASKSFVGERPFTIDAARS